MPIFEIQSPDGTTYEVDAPDQTAALSAFEAVSASGSKPDAAAAEPPATPQGTPGITMGRGGPVPTHRATMTLDDGMRVLANGMTFGLADKAAGGMDAVTGQAGSYDEGVKAQRGRTEEVRKANPGLAGATEIAGGLVTGGGLVTNGITLAGKAGSSLLPRLAAFGTEAAAYGSASGAGNTYSDNAQDYIDNAWSGAKTAGQFGLAIPVFGSLAGAAVRGLSAAAGPTIEGVSRAGSALLRGAAQADEAGLRALPKMGPDAMLVDAGPSMLGLGQGAGTGTGAGRTELVNALRMRDKATNDRLAGTLDEALGPAPTPSRINAGLDESRETIGRRYGRLPLDNQVDTQELADSLDEIARQVRGPAQSAVRKVRGYLDEVDGVDTGDGIPLARDARTLFETRQAIDGLMSTEVDPKALRQLSIARQSVDEMLDHAVPGIKTVDGQFQEVARQGDALQRGGQVFDTGKTAIRPEELSEEMATAALPRGEMVGPSGAPYRMRQGARADIDRRVGTNINDLGALERTLATPRDWNSQKMEVVFGKDATEKVAEALTTNRRFRESYQSIVQGSQTAQRTQAAKALDAESPVPMDTTLAGAGLTGIRAVVKALLNISREGTKDDVAKILASKGPQVQEIVEELLKRANEARQGAATSRRVLANPAVAGAAGQYGGRK